MIGGRSLLMTIGYAAGLALIGWQLLRPVTTSTLPVEPDPVVLAEVGSAPLTDLPLDEYAQIVERLLFAENRRPPQENSMDSAATPKVQPEAPADLSGLRLSAVLRGPDLLTAVIEQPDGESRTVTAGDQLEDWKVIEIQDDRVVLSHRGQRQVLDVHDFSYLKNRRPPAKQREITAERRRQDARRRVALERNDRGKRPPRARRAQAREEED